MYKIFIGRAYIKMLMENANNTLVSDFIQISVTLNYYTNMGARSYSVQKSRKRKYKAHRQQSKK